MLIEDETETDNNDNPAESSSTPPKIFKATSEWKEVEDEVLPKGLHVRINLETGKKEAKILENSNEVDIHSKITSNYQVIKEDAPKQIPINIKNLNDFNDLKEISKSANERYKSIKESKVHFTSETILLKETLETYSKESNLEKRIALLSDMEYFVHSIDLANDFFQIGGFDLLQKHLNETNTNIQAAVLNVFGASIQSNLGLKSLLLKADFARQIIVLLNNSKDIVVLKKCLFVLSVFLRNYPLAQKIFFQSFDGVSLLESILNKDFILAIKASTLLSDIAIEIATAASSSSYADIGHYETISFETIVKQSTVCSKLIQLMHNVDLSNLITLIENMLGLARVCHVEFRKHTDLFQQKAALLRQENDHVALGNMKDLLSVINLKDEL